MLFNWRRLGLILILIPVLWLVLANNSQAASGSVVSLAVDGQRRGFSTDAQTVAEVLARAQVRLNKQDLVEPALDTRINTGVFYINVYRAKPAIVIDRGREIRVDTPYTNPKLIVQRSAKIKTFPEDEFQAELVRDFVDQSLIGHKVIVNRSIPITLVVDGKPLKLRTGKTTVKDLLEQKGIALGKTDIVRPGVNTRIKPNMKISVIRVGKKVVSLEENVPFEIQTTFDNNKPAGYEEVRQQGANGRQLVTYEIKYHDGKEASRKVLEKVIITQPVTKIVIRGVTSSDDVWADLRFCESGGDYSKNTGNGYYGAYQFSAPTWQSMGTGYDYAHQAPPNVQDAAAQALQARSGWGQWPACARKLGLY